MEFSLDPNEAGDDGRTVLHHAAAGKAARKAAILLSHGADWTITDSEGKSALALEHVDIEMLHRVRQEYLRLRVSPYRGGEAKSKQARRLVARMRKDGLVRVSDMIPAALLQTIRSDIGTALREMKPPDFCHYDQKEYWNEKHQACVFNDALAYSDALAKICCDPTLVETANFYLGKKAHIKRVYGMRYLPKEQVDTEQFGWHHDMEDRLFKVMILLTDVGEDDQYMCYARGMHNAFHPYPCFLKNTLSFDHYGLDPKRANIVKTLGKAGDLFLFDPNGMHRGHRSMGRIRDALFIEYTADGNQGNIWGSELTAGKIDTHAPGNENPLAEFKGLTPKWERVKSQPPRKRPTWAESLEDPANWIRDEDKKKVQASTGGQRGLQKDFHEK